MIIRDLQQRLTSWLFKGKILLLFGARQVGKTTLCKNLLAIYNQQNGHELDHNYFSCERPAVRDILQTENVSTIKAFIGDSQLVIFDEAQYIDNIGHILKLLHDEYPKLQIIATGSSSFELANRLNEPLTGRAIKFTMYPFGLAELTTKLSNIVIQEKLQDFLRYGLYPAIYNASPDLREELLINLSEQYLYKDLLLFENLKNSKKINALLKLLALQLGNEVSINELATQLGFSRSTVERFLDLLEKMFVIIRVGGFSRNLRKEITKKSKYYFYDLGIRNAVLNLFNPIDTRQDIGGLWENFCILERLKFLHNQGKYPNIYFWRTHDQKEIDYLEEKNSILSGFEFKWQEPAKYTIPSEFCEEYPGSQIRCISQNNWSLLLTSNKNY